MTTAHEDYLRGLAHGRVYSRRELHHHLGGERQRGISYPCNGGHVLLFSDPSDRSHGYHDAWLDGGLTYRYWGMWFGSGPMMPNRGNAAIVKRSPHLYLFLRDGMGYRFEGQFACREQVDSFGSNRGTHERALVFLLERADRRQTFGAIASGRSSR